MPNRTFALPLTLIVAASVAACGGSSKPKSTSTGASQSTTASTPATQSTPPSAASPNAAVCAEATNDLRPLQAAASTNNASQIEAQAGQAAPKLIALQSHPGISPQIHAALGELTAALEAFAHGARGQGIEAQLSSAGKAFAAACT